MRLVLIGSGNVATVFGRLAIKNGHSIMQVVSRNPQHAAALAYELHCAFGSFTDPIAPDADAYLFALSDAGLYSLQDYFKLDNRPAFHTAGSVSSDVLQGVSSRYGVLYPLQSLRKEMDYAQDIPLLIDGNTEATKAMLSEFARSISGNVTEATDEQRLKLHVAAVIVSNFTNHLYALAEEFCEKENVPFKLLQPLIEETAGRLKDFSPAKTQTGPAARKDIFTLDKHLRMLSAYPQLKYIYLKLTDSIMKNSPQ